MASGLPAPRKVPLILRRLRRGAHAAWQADDLNRRAVSDALAAGPHTVLAVLGAHGGRVEQRPSVRELADRFAAQLIAETHHRHRQRMSDFLCACGIVRRGRTDGRGPLPLTSDVMAALTSEVSGQLLARATSGYLTVGEARQLAAAAYERQVPMIAAPSADSNRRRWLSTAFGAHRFRRLHRLHPDAHKQLTTDDMIMCLREAYRTFSVCARRRERYADTSSKVRAALRVVMLERFAARQELMFSDLAVAVGVS